MFSDANNGSFFGTISYDISDHLPIYYCAYNNSNNNNNNNIVNNQATHASVLRNLTKTNINNFINEISKEKWTPIYDQNNPDNAYYSFLMHYDYCFPFLRKSPKSNIPKKDWCTFDIAKSCKIKCKLYKTFTHLGAIRLHKIMCLVSINFLLVNFIGCFFFCIIYWRHVFSNAIRINK